MIGWNDASPGRLPGRPTHDANPMPIAYFITHLDVLIDLSVPVPDWPLSPRGRERMVRLPGQPWAGGLRALWCSKERKARDGAEILAGALGLPVTELERWGRTTARRRGTCSGRSPRRWPTCSSPALSGAYAGGNRP